MGFPKECTETFWEGHVRAFKFFGFVPRWISYDNNKIAMSKILGPRVRKLTYGFKQLLSHYLFKYHFCLVRRPNEKGVAEGVVKFARLNFFVPVPEVRDFDKLNAYLLKRCQEDLARRLRGKTLTKAQLLLEDQVASLPLPEVPFEACKRASTISNNESLVRQLASGEYIDRRENILLAGNSGTGKTHLAIALGFTACAQGRRGRFFTVTGLVTYLLEAREDRQLQRILEQLGRHQLLILDELGYVPFSKAGAELLFEVVSRAYEQTSLIVTTNLPFENWTEVMGSERLTGALLDRLSHRIHILEANGQSYRLKESRRRLKSAKPSKPIPDQRKTNDQTEEEK